MAGADAVSFTSEEDDKILANKPYIIALPGKEYNNFSLEDVELEYRSCGEFKLEPIENLTMRSQYSGFEPETSTNYYVLNNLSESDNYMNSTDADGSNFDLFTSGKLKPFRGYIALSKQNGSYPRLRITDGVGVETMIFPSTIDLNADHIYSAGNIVYINSDVYKQIDIYDLRTGIVMRRVDIAPGMNQVCDLPRGIYLIEKNKIVVR